MEEPIHAQPQQPIRCNGCKLGLEETSDSVVVSFGDGLWHVDCRCAKCQNLVEHDTNLLLLADGSPVCENCSYVCSFCQQSISNEAIVTGDESYHADCFRCKSCNTRIEELVFAKTSQGIYCMSCHNERVARTRKHAESKRNKSLRRKNRDGSSSATSSTPNTGGTVPSSLAGRSAPSTNTQSTPSRHNTTNGTPIQQSPQPQTSSGTLPPSATTLDPPSPYLSPLLRNHDLPPPASTPASDNLDITLENTPPLSSPSANGSMAKKMGDLPELPPPTPPAGLKKLRNISSEKDRERGESSNSKQQQHQGAHVFPPESMLRSRSNPDTAIELDGPGYSTSSASSPSRSTFDRERSGHVASSSQSSKGHSTSSSSLGVTETAQKWPIPGPTVLTHKPSVEFTLSQDSSSESLVRPLDIGRRSPSIGDETVVGASLSRSVSPGLSIHSESNGPRVLQSGPEIDIPRPRSPLHADAGDAVSTSKSNGLLSLSAPKSNKNANRRSGFYGINAITSPPLSAASTAGATAASSSGSPISESVDTSRDDYFLIPQSSSNKWNSDADTSLAASNASLSDGDVTLDAEADKTSQSIVGSVPKHLQPLAPPPRSDSHASGLSSQLVNSGNSVNGSQVYHSVDPSSSSSTISTSATTSSDTSSSPQTHIPRSKSTAHQSIGFYDPDVLVFLDAVNDPTALRRSSTAYNTSATPTKLSALSEFKENIPTSPNGNASPLLFPDRSPGLKASPDFTNNGHFSTFSNSTVDDSEAPLVSPRSNDDPEQEHLSPVSVSSKKANRRSINALNMSTSSMTSSNSTRRNKRTSRDIGRYTHVVRDDATDEEFEDKAKTALRKVRESIRKSRGDSVSNGSGLGLTTGAESTSSAMTVDVDLVELLISELEETKNKMKELQKNYNAIRRASRSAFEGFSMAREEYDREVQARRDAEFEMMKLKQQMREQASKISALDEESKRQELLQRKNTELRTSMVGMEKELSKIKVERDLTLAEVEELANVPKDEPKSAIDAERLSVNLNDRLSTVKEGYRSDLEKLSQEKDQMIQDIEELKITKDIFTEESNALNKRNAELSEEISEATRKLEALKADIAKAHKTTASSGSVIDSTHSQSPTAPLKAKSLPVAKAESLPVPKSSLRSGSPSSNTTNGASAASGQSLSAINNRKLPTTPSPAVDEQPAAFVAHKVEHVVPQATARKFKWGSKKGVERPLNASISKHPLQPRSLASSELNSRQHTFQPTSILRPVRCEHCGDKMWGMGEQRCSACGVYCHTKCASSFHIMCNSAATIDESPEPTTTMTMFGNDLVAQCLNENRLVPQVVTKCIEAVEDSAMEHEGIYRKSGGMGQTKLISACFDRGEPFDLKDQDRFNDISAITSVLKNYFRSLPNPLYTFEFHQEFCSLAEMKDADSRLTALETLLHSLPEQHFATLKALMLHLNRIHRQSYVNKMTPANLGVVFGPTLLRSPDPSQEFSQMHLKARIVELSVENAPQLFADPFKGS